MEKFREQVKKYEKLLAKFIADFDLPTEWFKVPDHLAVKGADTKGFEELIAQFRPLSEQLSCIDMDGRRLATAKLKEDIPVGKFGLVSWLEIMEPRPEKVGKDVVGLEHMEFYYPDFAKAIKVLKDRGINYTMQENPGHAWINIVLNKQGQELKLNNQTLGYIVTKELATGESQLI